MNDIQGLGRGGYGPQTLRGGAADGSRLVAGLAPGLAQADASGHLGSITNARGQTLFDIRDQLKSAVIEALASHDGTGDRQTLVRDAIHSTLEANGFDPAALDAARADFNPMQSVTGRANPFAVANRGLDGADLDAMFGDDEDEKGADDFLQALLGQLRAGNNLDLEI